MPGLPITYVLIALSINGTVSSSKYDTEQLCNEAKSIAIYGSTIEEKKEDDERLIEREKKQKEEDALKESNWLATHAPRQPTEEEKKYTLSSHWCNNDVSSLNYPNTHRICHTMLLSGLVQDDYPTTVYSIFPAGIPTSYTIRPARAWCLSTVGNEDLPSTEEK